MKVNINTFIEEYLPFSGTAEISRLLTEALGEIDGTEVRRYSGPRLSSHEGLYGKVARLIQANAWDLFFFGLKPCDVAVYPTNIGGWVSRSKKKILVVHDTMVFDRSLNYSLGYYLQAKATWRLSLVLADVIVTPSRYSEDAIRSRWPRLSTPIVVVPWPSKMPLSTRRIAAPSLTILVLGVTLPHKRHWLAIEAVHELRKRTKENFILELIGPEGPVEADVRQLTQKYDPHSQWIRRRRDLSEADLIVAFDSAFALVQPSEREGFGLPLVEAAARGLPVIHTGAGAMTEVHPSGVAAANPVAIAEQLMHLYVDGYAKASELSLHVAERHTINIFTEKVRQLISETYKS